MLNEIEVLSSHGTWLLWNNQVKEEVLGNEVFRAMQTYDKVRVNGGAIYQKMEK